MPGGRPNLYLEEVKDKLILVQGWARDGLINEQIANNLGISTKTLYEWKNKYSEFSEALKKGKKIIDMEVENALLKRAMGYSYTELQTSTDADGNVFTKEIVKEVTPDTTAQIFWLKNRKPKEWRDKQVMGIEGDSDKPVTIKIGSNDYD